MNKKRKLPTQKRQYHSIVGLDSGLDYSTPSTMIAETYTPECEEVTFRDKVVEKARGTDFFAGTSTTPLTSTVMLTRQYVKNNENEKLIVHTTTNVYDYNTSSDLLECITEGVVIDDCAAAWAVEGAVTCATSTNARKGTYSIAVTIPAAFTDDIAAYKDFAVKDLHTYDHLHFYIKSSVTVVAGQLRIRLSDKRIDEGVSHSPSASVSGSPSSSTSPSASISASPSTSPSASVSASPSESLSASPSPSISASPSASLSGSPSASPSASASYSPSTGTGGDVWAEYNVPALTAGVWKEVSVALASPAAAHAGVTCPTDLTAIESVSLVVVSDIGAQIVNLDDIMCTIESTGDVDNNVVAAVVNDYYIFSNGTEDPLLYWNMGAGLFVKVTGGANLGCKAMAMLGERLCIYHILAADAPRRVMWTIIGGVSTPPVATDWTDDASGAGDVDLDSTFGEDVIQTAHKLGNYVVLYGKKTIVMQEYIGLTSRPFAFYTRVNGKGVPSERGVANLGDKHIFLGWDDIYLYRGGTDVESIGDRVSKEIFSLINPTYIHLSFTVYLEEQHEIRVYFPLIGSSTPNCYFTYSLDNGSWSRGSRSYTAFGQYKRVEGAFTWDTIGTATTTWDEVAIRWNDTTNETLSSFNIYGDANGIVYKDDESILNNAGVAIDGYWDTKDFVVGDSYRRGVTNWMALGFEATGDTVMVSYSTDLGSTYSVPVTFTLTEEWKEYKYDLNINSSQVRFRFRNYQLSETFSLRQVELGYLEASDRGVA